MQWFLEPKKIVSQLFPLFPHLFAMKWWDWMPWFLFLERWVLSQLFHSLLSISSRNSFSSSLLSAISMVSSAYLRLLIFLPAILIPACASSSQAFCVMYSAYKLNKQGDNIQLWHTPFSIWNKSIVPCLVLTVAFWPAYRFLRRPLDGDSNILDHSLVKYIVRVNPTLDREFG